MVTVKKNNILKELLSEKRKSNPEITIGFVPTMGALHKGHLSLMERAAKENDLTVCSIFINPLQFNNKEDFNRYPRLIDRDLELINNYCNIVFIPEAEEILSDKNIPVYDLGGLDKYMEGIYRPGHFQGVAHIVKLFFDLINPSRAYFGQKDFQQLAIIKYLVKSLKLNLEIVECPTLRERNGLAMSSRNMLLNQSDFEKAAIIYKILTLAKKTYQDSIITVADMKKWVNWEIKSKEFFKLEYFEIFDAQSLKPIDNWTETEHCVACIALYMGKVRLIDNVIIF